MLDAPITESSAVELRQERYYRPELDALRFFAFLCVFLFHTDEYVSIGSPARSWVVSIRSTGTFGVQIFFLLSAFLITELLFREKERTGRIHVKAFYVRRILRIWPLYFSVFFGLALLNYFVHRAGSDNPHAWLAFTFLCGNWYIGHHGWTGSAIDPLWSISIEEQFYLVIPVLAALSGRVAVIIASCLLLVLAYVAVLHYSLHPNNVAEWTNSFVEFQFFCAGALISLLLRGRVLPLIVPLRIAGFIAGLVCWRIAVAYPYTTACWLLALLGTIVLFLSTLGSPSRLVPGWLSYFGKISYGLYVFHALVLLLVFRYVGGFLTSLLPRRQYPSRGLQVFEIALALALDLVFAHLSYVYFEGFFLRLKRHFTFVASRD